MENTEQKGWREGYWDIFLQEFEMSDFARFAIKKEIERTLQKEREEMVKMIEKAKVDTDKIFTRDERQFRAALNSEIDTIIALIKDTKI